MSAKSLVFALSSTLEGVSAISTSFVGGPATPITSPLGTTVDGCVCGQPDLRLVRGVGAKVGGTSGLSVGFEVTVWGLLELRVPQMQCRYECALHAE